MREPDEPAQPADPLSEVEHDLVNSLASIAGFSQLIRRDPSLPDDLRHSADLLVEEAARTRQMVQVLLDAVRQRPTETPTAVPRHVAQADDVATASATTTTARPSVLVLDDEPTFRIFLDKALGALGYDPEIATSGPEAVERATAGDHAVLLVDHQMPGMSGTDVYDAVIAVSPDVAGRFVLMSGDVVDPALEAFAAANPVTLLSKPFDIATLERTLHTVIEATGQSRGYV